MTNIMSSIGFFSKKNLKFSHLADFMESPPASFLLLDNVASDFAAIVRSRRFPFDFYIVGVDLDDRNVRWGLWRVVNDHVNLEL